MFFHRTRHKRTRSDSLYISDNQINRVKTLKLLGVFFYNQLTWSSHTGYIQEKYRSSKKRNYEFIYEHFSFQEIYVWNKISGLIEIDTNIYSFMENLKKNIYKNS